MALKRLVLLQEVAASSQKTFRVIVVWTNIRLECIFILHGFPKSAPLLSCSVIPLLSWLHTLFKWVKIPCVNWKRGGEQYFNGRTKNSGKCSFIYSWSQLHDSKSHKVLPPSPVEDDLTPTNKGKTLFFLEKVSAYISKGKRWVHKGKKTWPTPLNLTTVPRVKNMHCCL